MAEEAALLFSVAKSGRALCTVFLAVVGIGIFYSFQFTAARSFMAYLLVLAFRSVGLPSEQVGPVLVVAGAAFQITSECLYMGWLLVSIPFLVLGKEGQLKWTYRGQATFRCPIRPAKQGQAPSRKDTAMEYVWRKPHA